MSMALLKSQYQANLNIFFCYFAQLIATTLLLCPFEGKNLLRVKTELHFAKTKFYSASFLLYGKKRMRCMYVLGTG